MARPDFDVVVVGARCAGASLATFLARSGASVLVVDKDPLPSDQVLSTHTIHPPGTAVLDEVGIGDALREVTPPSRVVRLAKGNSAVDLPLREGHAEYCPRRHRLDRLLQEAAVEAGADLRDRTRVVDLQWRNDRVSGVRLRHGDIDERVSADLVIGADGRHSTVAERVNAEEYLAYDAPRAMFWSYWDAPKVWHDRSAYPFDMYIGNVDGNVRVIFQTDNDQLLVGALPVIEQGKRWAKDADESLRNDLGSDPLTGPLIAGRQPSVRVRGVIKERYFFRRGAGRGWALVGDAGHHKEFVIGDGISEALVQALSLAKAIRRGGDSALRRWWRERDVEALPLFFFGRDEGLPGPPLRIQEHVFAAISKRPDLGDRLVATIERAISPYDAIPPTFALRSALRAALRGELGCLREFFVMAKRGMRFAREMKRRQQLLEEMEAKAGAR